MQNTTKFSWLRLLRGVVAMTMVLAMLLCGCATGGPGESTPNKNHSQGLGNGKLEAQDVVNATSTIYGRLLKALGGGLGDLEMNMGTETDLTVTLGDDILSQLGSLLESNGLGNDVSWLREIGIGMNMNMKDDLMQESIELSIGDTSILSADMIMNMATSAMFIGLPQISNTYLGMEIPASDPSVIVAPSVGGMSGMVGQLGEYADIINSLPTEQELNTLLTRYLNIVLDSLPKATTATETLTFESVSQEVTTTTYSITTYDILDMGEAVLKAVQTDAELEKILDNLSKYSNGKTGEDLDLHQEMIDHSNRILQDIAETKQDMEDSAFIAFSVFTGKDDKQIGFRLQPLPGTEEHIDPYYIYTLQSNDQTVFVMDMGGFFRLAGTGTTKDNKANGTYTLSMDGEQIATVEVKDFNTKALEAGNLEGTLRVKLSEQILSAMGENAFLTPDTVIEIVMKLNDTTSDIVFNLYQGTKFMISLSISSKIVSTKNISIPANYVNVLEDPDAINGWMENADFSQIMSNLRKAGVPEDLVTQLEALLAEKPWENVEPDYEENENVEIIY